MAKKAQAAMEFLMTYGWAILVVLAAIGALAYFGVFTPSSFISPRCTIEPGFDCKHKVTPTEISLIITNGKGVDLSQLNITAQDNAGNDICNPETGLTLNDGESLTVTLDGCSNGAIGTRLKAQLLLKYQEVGGFSHTARGTIVARVE